eukprot:3655179-Rhodomonas_salina.1
MGGRRAKFTTNVITVRRRRILSSSYRTWDCSYADSPLCTENEDLIAFVLSSLRYVPEEMRVTVTSLNVKLARGLALSARAPFKLNVTCQLGSVSSRSH